MKKNFKLFFDMDDTIADFGADRHANDVKEVIHKPGFFETLQPLPFLNEVNKLAAIMPENVFIISACVDSEFCINEKIKWLKTNLPAASKENVLFTGVGENKAEYVAKRFHQDFLDSSFILIDDFSRNLSEWSLYGGTAIKFQNSFNTADPSKYKYIIKDLSELMETLLIVRKSIENGV